MEELIQYHEKKVIMLSSHSVAQKLEVKHYHLMQKIDQCIANLAERNLDWGMFFIKSTYIDSQNQKRPYYRITKMGAEFLGNKMIGPKGAEFTALYVKEFNRLQEYEKQQLEKDSFEVNKQLIVAKEVILSGKDMLIGNFVKVLPFAGNAKQLRQLLKWKGILDKKGVPYSIYVKYHQYFTLKKNKYSYTPVITPKGQEWILNNYSKWIQERVSSEKKEDKAIREKMNKVSTIEIVNVAKLNNIKDNNQLKQEKVHKLISLEDIL